MERGLLPSAALFYFSGRKLQLVDPAASRVFGGCVHLCRTSAQDISFSTRTLRTLRPKCILETSDSYIDPYEDIQYLRLIVLSPAIWPTYIGQYTTSDFETSRSKSRRQHENRSDRRQWTHRVEGRHQVA